MLLCGYTSTVHELEWVSITGIDGTCVGVGVQYSTCGGVGVQYVYSLLVRAHSTFGCADVQYAHC
jgi:hypothetical protein